MNKEWIPSSEQLPELRQNILATIDEHGHPTVVACWYVGDNRIKMDSSPNAKTYDFSIVKAWIPFPKPYMELEPK
ncbi:hypothetical protein FVR03_10905 [Pontibacter qinzhouensis]|uniref:DUF551 domain-containing protein n=1 Tax=Pontibacter qinzhouensis TaxID=2603253 RepID=A0A5C8KA43_9BACT|nr:hypothetical protein [Pontibacter qinzhouensis]TXK46386.1 hypothetical protein FVR03_10905 [Pontibacter qinzhouensis]